MKNISKILILAFILLMVLGTVHAEKFKGGTSSNTAPTRAASTCLPATNSNQLTINNVRAYLETNGTMWFNEIAQYEVPIGSGKTSMFAAALWIGGLDVNQQLKLAGMQTIILDHHEAEHISEDAIIINNQLSDYPNKNLSGAGVVWQFCKYLDSLLEKNIADNYLDLVALGLTGDMMSLQSIETKHLINKGFKDENIQNPFI